MHRPENTEQWSAARRTSAFAFTPQSNLVDAGLDSLAVTQLLLSIEESTGVWVAESLLTASLSTWSVVHRRASAKRLDELPIELNELPIVLIVTGVCETLVEHLILHAFAPLRATMLWQAPAALETHPAGRLRV